MSGRRLLTVLSLGAALAVLAAGCGSAGQAAYTAKGTVKCLVGKGFTKATTNPHKVGFIAGVAENGGLQAVAPGGNVLTIAFAQNAADAASTKQAFRENASPFYRRHIADIMESQRNAVLVWTTSPSQALLATALGCLAS
jgi:phosphoribosylamine-glycine ligase